MTNTEKTPLTIAIPKGRLLDSTREYFAAKGINFDFEDRKLVAWDKQRNIKFLLVKNSDLPTYVNHGIAGLGICGSDVLYEAGYNFYKIMNMPYGSTKMCLAGKKDGDIDTERGRIRIATKFTNFTRDYYHKKGYPVEIIKLNGSVELAPVLGLAPFIVDLVETGSTLKANSLEILDVLETITVYLIANPAYFKFNFADINGLTDLLR